MTDLHDTNMAVVAARAAIFALGFDLRLNRAQWLAFADKLERRNAESDYAQYYLALADYLRSEAKLFVEAK